jgi:type IV pilus assembly protein PilA
MRMKTARMRTNGETGFTLVELLVVMAILGILAAIGIPAFLSQEGKAHDVSAKSAAGTAKSAIEVWATDRDGSYLGADADDLRSIEPTLSDVTLSEPITTADTYTVEVVSDTGAAFSVSRNDSGRIDTDCTPPGTGGCPPDGNWN